jgi:hypothetical protein
MPDQTGELSVCWNDARLSNAIFEDVGQIVGALDREQACLCPAETDFAWWLATRRQMLEVNGLDLDLNWSVRQPRTGDPPLRGDDRAPLSTALVRGVRDGADGLLHLRTQELLRSIGQATTSSPGPIRPRGPPSAVSGLDAAASRTRRKA